MFACLVLKDFEKKDYRGVCQLLEDCADLRDAIGLKIVPHFTMLQKASRRLLKQKHVRQLVDDTVKRIRKRSKTVMYAAADSSGFDARHASRYFIWRTAVRKKGKEPKSRTSYKYFGKLMLIVCTATHAILGAVASRGPTPDIDQLDTVLMELAPSQKLEHLVADAGFDSAYNHALLREHHGIRSTIPPEHGRPPKDPATLPTDRYRRLMKTRFNVKAYRKRSQVETLISMLKRNFGSSLRGKSHWSRCRDMYLRVLTHNIALALLWVFYRATLSPLYVHMILEKALLACQEGLSRKRINLVKELTSTRFRLYGDARRLYQVFWNLLSNAIKFTPHEGSITVRTCDVPAGRVAVEVHDSGVGIRKEKLPLVIHLFEQGGTDITVRYGGFGLGLAICRGIVTAHQGAIVATSKGEGSERRSLFGFPATAHMLRNTEITDKLYPGNQ